MFKLSIKPMAACRRPFPFARTLLVFSMAWACPPLLAAPLTLEAALQQSLRHSAATLAGAAALDAARESAVSADQLPDPRLKLGIDNLPVSGADRWSLSRDFMTMRRVGIEQQWVAAEKRSARAERAQKAVDNEEGAYLLGQAGVRRDTAIAWIDLLFAQRLAALAKALETESARDLDGARASYRGAGNAATEITQARLGLVQAQDRADKATQDAASAAIALARWTLQPEASADDKLPPLTMRLANLPLERLEQIHPTLVAGRRAVSLARSEAGLASKERSQDWSFEASFSQRGGQYGNMVSFGASIPLTLNAAKRQDREVAAAAAMAEVAQLRYQDTLRELQADIAVRADRLRRMDQRLTRLKGELLPVAQQQVGLASAAYRSGSGPLSAIFSARKTLLEVQMQAIELEKEAALTWASLEFFVVQPNATSTGSAFK